MNITAGKWPFSGRIVLKEYKDLCSSTGAELYILKKANDREKLLFSRQFSEADDKYRLLELTGVPEAQVFRIMERDANNLYRQLCLQSKINHSNVAKIYEVTKTNDKYGCIKVEAITDIPSLPHYHNDPKRFADAFNQYCDGIEVMNNAVNIKSFSSANLQLYNGIPMVSLLSFTHKSGKNTMTVKTDAESSEQFLLRALSQAATEIYSFSVKTNKKFLIRQKGSDEKPIEVEDPIAFYLHAVKSHPTNITTLKKLTDIVSYCSTCMGVDGD